MRRADHASRSRGATRGPAAAAARWFTRAAAVVRRLIGAPDYEGYVAFVAATNDRVMSQREFTEARLAAKYDRPGSRCC
ncbi:MAG: YbdD/YjiX family protein [Gemmatimonadaceae bacterium]|nr:YbdD/YjiX family protein [Gemmatimonadaceae bacterium]